MGDFDPTAVSNSATNGKSCSVPKRWSYQVGTPRTASIGQFQIKPMCTFLYFFAPTLMHHSEGVLFSFKKLRVFLPRKLSLAFKCTVVTESRLIEHQKVSQNIYFLELNHSFDHMVLSENISLERRRCLESTTLKVQQQFHLVLERLLDQSTLFWAETKQMHFGYNWGRSRSNIF